ncbi:hypothetical protein [Corynebacterium crudilactis]|uniref:hypothetical protein n=1 Tax=Corynebacterium crudilactis TaxID=1652495 RepID=UPI0014722390|nr:hypothetical protein [Corynebacterium crudilactis]
MLSIPLLIEITDIQATGSVVTDFLARITVAIYDLFGNTGSVSIPASDIGDGIIFENEL